MSKQIKFFSSDNYNNISSFERDINHFCNTISVSDIQMTSYGEDTEDIVVGIIYEGKLLRKSGYYDYE